MKHIVTIAFISTCIFTFGQSDSYWNNYANFNPATSGFQYKQHAAATYFDYFPRLSVNYNGIYADAGINIKKHHGIGVAYTGDFNSSFGSHKAVVNYNYQFALPKAGKLSVGTGLGIGRYAVVDLLSPVFEPIDHLNSFELNLGASYNFKNLTLGLSATNLLPLEDSDDPSFRISAPTRGYYIHAQYAAQLTPKFQLISRVLYSYSDGFQRLQPNLTVSYLDKFYLGATYEFRNSFGVNTGWDILNKFRVAYNYSITISNLNNTINGGKHEVSIGYVIKN